MRHVDSVLSFEVTDEFRFLLKKHIELFQHLRMVDRRHVVVSIAVREGGVKDQALFNSHLGKMKFGDGDIGIEAVYPPCHGHFYHTPDVAVEGELYCLRVKTFEMGQRAEAMDDSEDFEVLKALAKVVGLDKDAIHVGADGLGVQDIVFFLEVAHPGRVVREFEIQFLRGHEFLVQPPDRAGHIFEFIPVSFGKSVKKFSRKTGILTLFAIVVRIVVEVFDANGIPFALPGRNGQCCRQADRDYEYGADHSFPLPTALLSHQNGFGDILP